MQMAAFVSGTMVYSSHIESGRMAQKGSLSGPGAF
jgi:hypothetical protein